jgi:hypothetical protein
MPCGNMVFKATFNKISVMSWWSVSLVEETGGPRETQGKPPTCHKSLTNWIGLNDKKEQNFFEWINGEVTKYTNWNVNQPANTNSQNENCVMINKTVSDVIKLTFHLFIRMGIQYSFTTTYAFVRAAL